MQKIASQVDLEDPETSLNEVNTVLDSVGISLTDTEGQLRDLDGVLDEVAARLNTFTRNQQAQISTA